jgi:hypothetical protein
MEFYSSTAIGEILLKGGSQMKKNVPRVLLYCALCMMFVMSGCSKTYVTGFRTESNFAFPNSNVSPLGATSGSSAPACSLLGVDFVTSSMQDEAVKNALQKKQGDILVNYLEFTTMTNLLILNCTSYSVEGTAAKMTVGMQNLK